MQRNVVSFGNRCFDYKKTPKYMSEQVSTHTKDAQRLLRRNFERLKKLKFNPNTLKKFTTFHTPRRTGGRGKPLYFRLQIFLRKTFRHSTRDTLTRPHTTARFTVYEHTSPPPPGRPRRDDTDTRDGRGARTTVVVSDVRKQYMRRSDSMSVEALISTHEISIYGGMDTK